MADTWIIPNPSHPFPPENLTVLLTPYPATGPILWPINGSVAAVVYSRPASL
jgi:hypothetical protein